MIEVLDDTELPEDIKVSIVSRRVLNRAFNDWMKGDDQAHDVMVVLREINERERTDS
jgi:hypothetical protein